MAKKLTLKQQAFSDYYIELGDATKAARLAGYSEKTASAIGSENLKKPNIKAYIAERLAQIQSKRIASAEEVLEYLTSVLRGESESEVVVVENIGDYVSEARRVKKAPDEKERLKAADLIGKRYGIYTEKLDVSGQVSVHFEGEDDLED